LQAGEPGVICSMPADTYAHVQDSAKVAALDVVERTLGV